MKRILSHFVLTLLVLTLIVPGFIFAQQRAQTPGGSTSSSGTSPASGYPGRKSARGNAGNGTAVVERDFDDALRLIQEQYIDGKKLDYNNVFKSSIIGMLRSLDPHSNYYDREEFDELKTDQRSEYFGIGASIQNYNYGDQTETFITATFPNSPANRAAFALAIVSLKSTA